MSYKPGDVIPKLGKVPEDVYEVQEGTCSLCGGNGICVCRNEFVFL